MPYATLAIHQLAAMTPPGIHPASERALHDRTTVISPPRRIRHIHIEIGALSLDYKASAEQAENVAEHLAYTLPELLVTVDDDVRVGLPPLPCAELWN